MIDSGIKCNCEIGIYSMLMLGFIFTDMIIFGIETLLGVDDGTIKWYTILSASLWALAIIYVFIKNRMKDD